MTQVGILEREVGDQLPGIGEQDKLTPIPVGPFASTVRQFKLLLPALFFTQPNLYILVYSSYLVYYYGAAYKSIFIPAHLCSLLGRPKKSVKQVINFELPCHLLVL